MINSTIIMPSRPNSTASSAAGNPSTAVIHPDIFQFDILNRLDGAALASASCASSHFLSLCSDDRLWRDLCNSTWPSTADRRVRAAISAFPSAHRSFYSDSFPSLPHTNLHRPNKHYPSELMSAVDIFYDNNVIFSKVLETKTKSNWFMSYPFSIDLLGPEETLEIDAGALGGASILEKNLKVSWILIDPVNTRAANVASEKALEVRQRWEGDDVQLRYTTVVAGGGGNPVQCAVLVTCRGKGGKWRVKEVRMQVEDMEGKIIDGKDSLGILKAALSGPRRRRYWEKERSLFDMFLRMKEAGRERRRTREMGLDRICMVTGLSVFFGVWIYFLGW